MSKARTLNWHRLIRNLHRDIGYLCIGLVLIYAISGIAVNHKNDWNPNYQVSREELVLTEQAWATDNDALLTQQLVEQLAGQFEIKTTYWQSPNQFKVFLQSDGNLSLNLENNTVIIERIEARPFFQALNRLHLNETHASWVVVSDIFAAMLIFLSLSALFMVRGKHSPWGRKGLLIVTGFTLPALYIFI